MGYGSRRGSGPPGWFVFLLGAAFIFGMYYLWIGVQNYMRTGGLSVTEATQVSRIDVTSTAVRREILQAELPTRRPTSTPKPPCQDFEVIVASAIIRGQATINSSLVDVAEQGAVVCVLQRVPDTNWYLIDIEPRTTRIEAGYMRDDLIRAQNPTPTPSDTPTMLPTITPTHTWTPTLSPTPAPTMTDDPDSTPTQTPSVTPSLTPDAVSL